MSLIPRQPRYPSPSSYLKIFEDAEANNALAGKVVEYLSKLVKQMDYTYRDIYLGMIGSKFEDRGDVTGWDLVLANATADSNYHEFSVANIVPESAIAIEVYMQARSNAATALAFVARTHEHTSTYNVLYGITVTANVSAFAQGIVPIHPCRSIDYYLSTSANWAYFNLFVRGWYL